MSSAECFSINLNILFIFYWLHIYYRDSIVISLYVSKNTCNKNNIRIVKRKKFYTNIYKMGAGGLNKNGFVTGWVPGG